MKRTVLAAATAIASAVAFAPTASAQLYAGAGLTIFQTDIDDQDINIGAAMGRLGYEINPFFAIEGEVALGLYEDDIDVPVIGPVDVGIDSGFGAFLVGKIPLAVVDLFGRVGYADVSIEGSAGGFTASEDGSGMAYGAGINFNVLILRMRAEYTRYEIDDGDVDSLGLSALLKF
jgi:outer membrane immunogenic protein